MRPDKPNFVGVVRYGGHYAITAEYADGYIVIAEFDTVAEAHIALPAIRKSLGLRKSK